MKLKIAFSLCIYIFLVNLNCGNDNGVKPKDETAASLTSEGWNTYFENEDYQQALTKFEAAIAKDSTYADAYNGAGWASARLTSLSDAVSFFSQCLNISSSIVDARAGLAFVYNAQKEYLLAVSSANSALSSDANWNFDYDQTLDYNDLRLVLAESYFALENYSSSLTEVKNLNSSFHADISTIEGKAALAAEIERLRSIV